jgi:hypothetical protein
VSEIAGEIGVIFQCLGITKSGQPRHPLYIAGRKELVAWSA